MRRPFVLAILGVFALAARGQPVPGTAPTPTSTPTPAPAATDPAPAVDPSDAFFAGAFGVPELKLTVTPEDMDKLRADPRAYVPFTFEENGKPVGRGGVKLKGAAGSYRDVDDRPALTINLEKFEGKALYHGLDKFHLNNSVQDESLLNEWVCAEVFRAGGYPATRAAHARVFLNGRDLGMYVLKEGFDGRFLKRHFGSSAGNLYDGGFCQDLDAEIELDSGKGVKDRSDLRRIVEACREPNEAERFARLERLVDVDALARFIALERLTAHWDGYAQSRNNYRVYFAPAKPGETGPKAWILPHGMDQTFNDPGFDVLGGAAGMLANAMLETERGRALYGERLAPLAKAFDAAALAKKIDEVQKRLQPALEKIGADAARAQADRARELVERLRARQDSLRDQLRRPAAPSTVEFPIGRWMTLDDWSAAAETDATNEEVEVGGVAYFRIASSGDRCIASRRHALRLPRGQYAFEAVLKGEGIEPLDEDDRGRGAGIRISGVHRAGALVGDEEASQQFQFSIEDDSDVVLVAELRAAKGVLLIRKDSLRILRASAHMPGDTK